MMPGVQRNPDEYLLRLIKQLQQQVAALGAQHQWGIALPNGVPVLNCGVIPDSGSPARWGLVLFAQDGVTPIAVFGQTGSGQYGLEVLDLAGNNRVQVGELASGDYGLQVTDTLGHAMEVNPFVTANIAGPDAGASTSWADFPTPGPSVAVVVGNTGRVLVEMWCIAGVAWSGGTPIFCDSSIGCSIDGGAPPADLQTTWFESGTYGALGPCVIAGVASGLTPGAHTFTMQYESNASAGIVPSYSNRTIKVTSF